LHQQRLRERFHQSPNTQLGIPQHALSRRYPFESGSQHGVRGLKAGPGGVSVKPSLGTSAPLDVAGAGDASATQAVKGNDSRLSDARTFAAHNQAVSSITGLATVATSGSASDLSTGTLPAARIPATAVKAGSCGSASLVPVITGGADGRFTAARTTAVSGGAAAVARSPASA